MTSIHTTKPKRTCKKKLELYTSYRKYIIPDFKESCGYCGDSDKFYGHYHIDHFRPHSIEEFKELKTEYSNLVYSCPFCNLSKSDTWLEEDGFIDPCDDSYDDHLRRMKDGKIEPKSPNGINMFKHLKLYLVRHELIWIIEKLLIQKEELLELRKSLHSSDDKLKVADAFIEIQIAIDNYTRPYMA